MDRIRPSWAWVIAAGSVLATPVALRAGGVSALSPAEGGPDWAAKIWDAALKGDNAAVANLLGQRPAGVDADGRIAKGVAQLGENFKARETKRADEIKKADGELDKAIAEGNGDLAVSQALKAAVELHMISTDKNAVMEDPRIKGLVQTADASARAAEERGDWLTASELYYRLDLLLEEHGTYKDDVKRETTRLAMIRMYAPERLWQLRNERRKVEIDWALKHKDADEEKPAADGQSDDKKAKKADLKPLPPYNPTGDSYKQKLEGIEPQMVLAGLTRAYAKHVERTSLETILRSGIDSLRTLATTEDLKSVFPGIADPDARAAFLSALATEDQRLAKPGASVGASDLVALIPRLEKANEQSIKIPRTALLHEFGNGGMAALDEFSAIIWPDEIRRFKRNTEARFKGVGIQIELDPTSNIRVVTPLDGTPAQRAGVRPGDLIKKVDGGSTEGFTLDQAVDVITGPADSQVVLTLERETTAANGEKSKTELEVTLVRAEIDVKTVKGWKRTGVKEDDWDWFIDPQDKIGYVRLTQFAERTDQEFDRAIDQMKASGLNGLVLDLRFNPGGLLDQAVAITSRFVGRGASTHYNGVVVTTHAKDNSVVQTERIVPGMAKLAGIPTVVLINEGSASASEIVSGALQDYAKSGDVKVVLLGSRSYGKGSVQNVWQLPGIVDAAIKVTTQYYHLPGGRMIHKLPQASKWGVEPNFTVEMLPGQITDSLILRQNADVAKMDQNGQIPTRDGEQAPNPDDLITKPLDLQLQEAILILEAQAAGTGHSPTLVESPSKP